MIPGQKSELHLLDQGIKCIADKMDIKFVNVLILGFGFMFVFTAFQTMGNIQVGVCGEVFLVD